MLLANAQFGDAAAWIDAGAEPPQQALRRPDHAAAVDERAGDQWLAAKKDVVGDTQFGNQIELLMDDRDASGFRIAHAAKRHWVALEANNAFVAGMDAGEDFHQCAFASAVLAHQRVHLAAPEIEVDVAKRCHAGERLGDMLGNKDSRIRRRAASDLPGNADRLGVWLGAPCVAPCGSIGSRLHRLLPCGPVLGPREYPFRGCEDQAGIVHLVC